MAKEAMKLVANNKKVYHDFFVDEKYEAGLVLPGTIDKGEVFRNGMHISPYEKGNIFNKDPLRVRKLLMHKSEIMKLTGKVAEKGYTLMPLQVYFKDGKAKMEIGLCRGKKLYDKRQDIAKKDARRESEREFKVKNLY